MLNRTILSGTVLLAMLGTLATTADAGDWSVSVSLGSGSSSYYALGGDSYYSSSRSYSLGSDTCRTYTYVPSTSYLTTTSCTPSVSYAPAVSYVPTVGYLPSVSYVDYDYCTPSTIRYSSCRSVPYTTTYTRSACYSEPVRHRRVVHHSSNHHRSVRMPYYSTPRVSDCSSRRVVRSHSSPRTIRTQRAVSPRRSDSSSRRVIRTTHRTSSAPRQHMHRSSPPRSHRHGDSSRSSHRTPRIRVRHR